MFTVSKISPNFSGWSSQKNLPTSFVTVIKKYCKCISATAVITSCQILIEHFKNLTGDIPVLLPPIHISCSIRNEVTKRVSELLESDFLTCQHHPMVTEILIVYLINPFGTKASLLNLNYNNYFVKHFVLKKTKTSRHNSKTNGLTEQPNSTTKN